MNLIEKSVEEVNILIKKYRSVLEVSDLSSNDEVQLLAIVIDVVVNYLNEKYNDLTPELKTWCVLVLKNKFNTFKVEDEVKKMIDNFIVYWNNEYQKYCNGLEMFTSEFDRDYGFIRLFQ